MASRHSLEEWARSLVGREWEIFWSDDGCCQDDKREIQEQQLQQDPQLEQRLPSPSTFVTAETPQVESNVAMVEAGVAVPVPVAATSDGAESEDVEDWYEGQIEAVESVKADGSFSFHVRFVGDENLYAMVLEPRKVRPSAQAWIKRSKALLNFPAATPQPASQNEQIELTNWEALLPPDTSTVDDSGQLKQLEAQHVGNESIPSTPPPLGNSDSLPTLGGDTQTRNLPSLLEFNRIKSLANVLSAQIYLRSRLAPVVELDDGPSEIYVDHLLECLKSLAEACRWYFLSWKLHCTVFFDSPLPLPLAPIEKSTGVSKWPEDYAIQAGLQEGRRVITRLIRIDTSLAGSKKRRPADNSSNGIRKTKRRRRNKPLVDFIKESERGSKPPSPDEDEFLSSDAVTNFAEQVASNDNRWYTGHFGKMMLSLSFNIVSPFLAWKYGVETILGDRSEGEGDSHSAGETSGEDSDEEGDKKAVGNPSEQSAKGKRFYTFEEIQACDHAATIDPVLKKFGLSKLQKRLQQKISDIEAFEKRCWSLIAQVYSKPNGKECEKDNDNIYLDLVSVRNTAISPASAIYNVSPLGRSSSVLCRKVLDDAITLRSWYLDLHRIESSKERLIFIDKMATRATELPRLPLSEFSATLDALFNEAVARLRRISQGYFDHLTRFNKYQSVLLSRSITDAGEGIDFMTSEGVTRALHELGGIQVLSVAEEMLSLRLDVLRWMANARSLLARDNIPFDEMVAIKASVDAILNGLSETRRIMLAAIEVNDKVNVEVRSFAEGDVAALCGSLVSLINSKYSITCGWKERATSIISTIKQHSGQCCSTAQKPPMVDSKRIHGLLSEYDNLGIFLPEDHLFLEQVYATTNMWSKELTDSLHERTKPLPDLLARLQQSKDDRPKGIIVNPARHVVDLLVDLLLWHKQTVESMKETSKNADSSSCTSQSICPLIAEGSEVLEVFGNRSGTSTYSIDHGVALDLMFKRLDSRRPMRVISCAKLESTALGAALLDRMILQDEDQGSPLLFLSHLLWQASMSDMAKKYDYRKGSRDAVTLESARDLARRKPIEKGPERWGLTTTEAETKLVSLVYESEKTEKEALRLLAVSKNLFRGPSRHPDAIQEHLGFLKELHGLFKVPLTAAGTGLGLKKTLEQKLEHHVKVAGWLIRTLSYTFLHKVHCDLSLEHRIPWDILVILHERKPGGLEKMGDCAGIALRLADVFEAANAWQQEITKVTMLSNRGGKRRGEASGMDADGSTLQMVGVEQVNRLAKDPVLLKVAMPRERAVTIILERAKLFETHLHAFLGKDYNGLNADRAPYPDTRSLIGKSGEFLLYRLTGSPLYDSLLSSMDSIATIAQDVLADTPGKAAFEWIRQAVAWIDSLRAAVTLKACSPGSSINRLVVTESDARSILDHGRSFFLDVPDDLRKTLSTHRILVSSTKVGEKLKVVIKKGGAHHSVGGTAVRWCPVLFDSLREDMSRLHGWMDQVEKARSCFTELSADREGSLDEDDEALTKLHELLGEVSMLIEEGVESLVVAPPKDAFEKLTELSMNLSILMSQNSAYSSYERIVRGKFEDSEMLLADRHSLLDSLLARSSLESDSQNTPILETISDSHCTFREACRSHLDKGLQKTLHLIGLDSLDPESAALTLCSTKAWEIELEMFARFQANRGADVISTDYKEKARILIWLFENCANPKVCILVLVGELEVPELVSMQEESLVNTQDSDKDFAPVPACENKNSPLDELEAQVEEATMVIGITTAQRKEDIVEVAKVDVELRTDAASETAAAPLSSSPPDVLEASSHPTEAKLEVTMNASVSNPSSTGVVNGAESPPSPKASLPLSPDPPSLDVPVHPKAPPSLVPPVRPEAPPSLTVPVHPDVPPCLAVPVRPDAPPSLAASLTKGGSSKKSSSKSSQQKSSKRGKYLLNSSGADSFFVAVSKPLLRFKARFYLESDRHARLNNLLPEGMTEKGRLRLDEFTKFLAGKLKGGRWAAVSIRMSVSSDEDAKKLKIFYKEYESMKRIAMFSVSEHTKLFLVTPKFHRTAEKIVGNMFDAEKSTYAIILTSRENR